MDGFCCANPGPKDVGSEKLEGRKELFAEKLKGVFGLPFARIIIIVYKIDCNYLENGYLGSNNFPCGPHAGLYFRTMEQNTYSLCFVSTPVTK
jgi:hypothetical protein